MDKRVGLTLITVLLCAANLRAQVVVGDVSAVGFRSSKTAGTRFVVRSGQWVPIQVQLTVQGSATFQGQLRYEAPDLDGDLVAYRETPVTATFDAGVKRAWVYAVWPYDPSGMRGPGTVDVLTDDGVLVNRLAVPDFDTLSNDTLLILDISAQPVTRLRMLQTQDWSTLDDGFGSRPYYRNVLVAAMPVEELPDRWFGLESVDVVVWDEPDPARPGIAQLEALRQWVENGGQLVVGLGQSWSAVRQSALAELLPLQTPVADSGSQRERGATLAVEVLEQFFDKLVAARVRRFPGPIAVAAAEARPGALRTFRSQVPGGDVIDLIATQWVGSGRVTAVAAGLKDLTQVAVNDAFYAQLFDLHPTTEKFREAELNSLQMTMGLSGPRSLYDDVVQPISLAGWSSVLVLAAFAFVVAYIGVATLVSWWWLRRHTLTTLSWTVFAAIAVVASALSLGTVSLLHGVSRGVRALNLVDLEAGSRAARATCYFGYTSPLRGAVDLSLAGEGDFLRPLATGRKGSSYYATPQRYNALAGSALLQGTPIRATLKQLEGFWQGELDGSIRAELTADRRSGEILASSWIQNDLPVNLNGGYLLYVDPRLGGDGSNRPAGQTANWWGRPDVPAGLNVLAVRVPPLGAGEKLSGLAQQDYAAVAMARGRWQTRAGRKLEAWPDLVTLWDEQQGWVGVRSRAPQRRLEEAAKSAFLASTRTLYLHCRESDGKFEQVNGEPITTDGLMDIDISHWLMHGRVRAASGASDPVLGQAVLLLWAEDPGPAQLHRAGKPLRSVGGRSMYRVRVPLNYTGRPGPPPVLGTQP